MTLKVSGIVLALVALPFLFEANTGCGFSASTGGLEDDQPNSYVCACSCSPGVAERVLRVVASEDDAEQRLDNNTVDTNSNDLDLAAMQVVGVRFRNVNIPPMANIVSANLQFTASSTSGGSVTYTIIGEGAANPNPFAQVVNDLTMRGPTSSSVLWINPLGWTSGDTGSDQRTPDLKAIVKELVDQPGWGAGNAMVLLISTNPGAMGARHAISFDTDAAAAPVLEIAFEEPAAPVVGPLDLPICVPAELNPNLGMPPPPTPTAEQLAADCTDRVQATLSGLAQACSYPSGCTCAAVDASLQFADKCDAACMEDPVDMDCSDFDPINNMVTATNAPGDDPVCLANSPLAQGIFGRRTRCEVEGTAKIEVEDKSETTDARGIVDFLGGPCTGGGCAVGMEYRLNIDPVTFSNFWGSRTFVDLAGLGATVPGGEAMLDMSGAGMFAINKAAISAQGRRGSDQKSLVTTNDDLIAVDAIFGPTMSMPHCALAGALVGTTDPEAGRCEENSPNGAIICNTDAECGGDVAECSDEICNCEPISESELRLSLDVTGAIVNQPPTADAGPDQTVECGAAGVSEVLLDGSASSDLDDNIALFNWFRGSRSGDEISSQEMTTVPQGKGAQAYVLRVIDALGQTDEDTTMASVVDTTAPVLSCAVTKPILTTFNNNLVNVGLSASAEDQCTGTLPVGVSVFSDEDDEEFSGPPPNPPPAPAHGLGPPFSPDAKNLAAGTLRLRQERRANRDGRVYLIVAEATDPDGNRGVDCCTVIVPLANTKASKMQAQAQATAAKAFCLANAGAPPPGYAITGNGPVIGPKQ